MESVHRAVYIGTDEFRKKRRKTQTEDGNVEEMLKVLNFLISTNLFVYIDQAITML